jgi:hypothetical protein
MALARIRFQVRYGFGMKLVLKIRPYDADLDALIKISYFIIVLKVFTKPILVIR